jgi:periplasmic divalent cation tolerance protein
MSDGIVVITTTETPKDGEWIAHLLVERELAACVQVLPQMTSVFRWQDHIERASETLLLIKTTRACYPAVEAAIKEHHHYQTPEIVALPITAGSADYLAWLASAVKPRA